jgi:hypothetical protein
MAVRRVGYWTLAWRVVIGIELGLRAISNLLTKARVISYKYREEAASSTSLGNSTTLRGLRAS